MFFLNFSVFINFLQLIFKILCFYLFKFFYFSKKFFVFINFLYSFITFILKFFFCLLIL